MPITMQFTALREEWMAGYTVMLENGPRQLNPSSIAVTGKGYSIYGTDMAGKKRQTLLQPYSKSWLHLLYPGTCQKKKKRESL